jgi:hypothetical protein
VVASVRFKARFLKLGMIWHIIRGYPVAYRIRIENGGLVLDGEKPGMVVQCTIVGAAAAAVTSRPSRG